jgi:Protein of unknown function (DUF664)
LPDAAFGQRLPYHLAACVCGLGIECTSDRDIAIAHEALNVHPLSVAAEQPEFTRIFGSSDRPGRLVRDRSDQARPRGPDRRGEAPRRFTTDEVAPPLARILFQLLQEYARHVGHVDVARELIDGVTGE